MSFDFGWAISGLWKVVCRGNFFRLCGKFTYRFSLSVKAMESVCGYCCRAISPLQFHAVCEWVWLMTTELFAFFRGNPPFSPFLTAKRVAFTSKGIVPIFGHILRADSSLEYIISISSCLLNFWNKKKNDCGNIFEFLLISHLFKMS